MNLQCYIPDTLKRKTYLSQSISANPIEPVYISIAVISLVPEREASHYNPSGVHLPAGSLNLWLYFG